MIAFFSKFKFFFNSEIVLLRCIYPLLERWALLLKRSEERRSAVKRSAPKP